VQHPKNENGNIRGASYNEGSTWNRISYHKCIRKKNSEKYENYANNTTYDKWLCVRMILKIMQ
jgi:hypothetical protein